MEAQVILRLLDALLLLTARIPALFNRLTVINDEVRAGIAEGRDPTLEEWDAVGDAIDAKIAARRNV